MKNNQNKNPVLKGKYFTGEFPLSDLEMPFAQALADGFDEMILEERKRNRLAKKMAQNQCLTNLK